MTLRISTRNAALSGFLAIATAFGGGSAVLAQSHVERCNGSHCAPVKHVTHRTVVTHKTVVHRVPEHRGPRIGGSGRGGRTIVYSHYHRLPRPGAHREYRVIDNRVVLVNTQTLAIVSVVGLASVLLAN